MESFNKLLRPRASGGVDDVAVMRILSWKLAATASGHTGRLVMCSGSVHVPESF